jgi:ribosome-binding factor A
MNSSQFRRDDLLQFCEEIYPEDGIRRKRDSEFRGISFHQLQLAKQLFIALDEIFQSELLDPAFEGIRVMDVSPIEETPNMFVLLEADYDILHDLNRIKGLIRSLAAEKVNRKKMPELKFGTI